jgi:TATA-box binding protein (TBP) (component of TFIID and TFIIIB)
VFKKNLKNVDQICHVNITNLKTLDSLGEALDNINTVCSNAIVETYSVDNITVSKDFLKEIILRDILTRLPKDVCPTYNSETFPGAFLKYPNKIGTAILFHTGKCVILGCKKISDIEIILKSLTELLI